MHYLVGFCQSVQKEKAWKKALNIDVLPNSTLFALILCCSADVATNIMVFYINAYITGFLAYLTKKARKTP